MRLRTLHVDKCANSSNAQCRPVSTPPSTNTELAERTVPVISIRTLSHRQVDAPSLMLVPLSIEPGEAYEPIDHPAVQHQTC